MMQKVNRKYFGFTLIELLVVMAIISVLAAILFPVFRRAREKTWTVSCQSNLKQIGWAIHMYANDWDQWIPEYYRYQGSRPFNVWGGWPLTIKPYIKTLQIFECPAANVPRRTSLERTFAKAGMLGYGMAVPYPGTRGYTCRLDYYRRPAEGVLICDNGATTASQFKDVRKYYWHVNWPAQPKYKWESRPAARHNEGVNILWVDGHVSWMRPERFYGDQFLYMWQP